MHASDADLIARLFLLPVALTIDPFAPILVLGICLRMGWINDPVLAGPAFAGFGNPAFLSVVAIFYVLHAFADKVPPVGHLFDGIGILVKPIAAALVGFWLAHKLSGENSLPWYAISLAVLGGIPATFGLQSAKAKIRAALSAVTFGFVHPVISGAENILGLLIALALIFHPIAGICFVLVICLPIAWLLLRLAKRISSRMRRVRKVPV